MADITLSQLVGGGLFNAEFDSGIQVISSGASGELFSITPPAGQRVKLTILATQSSAITETDIELKVDTATIFAPANLRNPATSSGTGSSIGSGRWDSSPIIFKVGEVISVDKVAGSTGGNIIYAYQLGA